jgi:hypothetical protein
MTLTAVIHLITRSAALPGIANGKRPGQRTAGPRPAFSVISHHPKPAGHVNVRDMWGGSFGWLEGEMDSELRLVLGEEDADAQRLDELSRLLRQELVQLDGDAVAGVRAVPAAEVPSGARAVDATSIEGLVVALGAAAQGISAVISIVQAWRARGGQSPRDGKPVRRARLEIDGDVLDLSGVMAEDDLLIKLFIGRHTGGGRDGQRPT